MTAQNLDTVLKVINDIAHKAAGKNYVYRGEPAIYEDISSGLYRRYKHQGLDDEGSAIEAIQNEIIAQARFHAPQLEDARGFEVLSELQHNGGKTNLIDFTKDYLIALFFACDGEPDQPGRVIMLSETGGDYRVDSSTSPVHRVLAQKSVFVRPVKGFIKSDDVVHIPSHLKQEILEYLHLHHSISTETMYNDLYGFIQHQDMHREAYAELYAGVTLADQEEYRQAIEHYNNALNLNPRMATVYNQRGQALYEVGDYDSAISDYERALSFDPENDAVYHNLGLAYAGKSDYRRAIQHYSWALELNPDDNTRYYRIESYLLLEEWESASEEIKFSARAFVNIVALFREYYSDVSEFERENDIRLPDDIAEMLGGRVETN